MVYWTYGSVMVDEHERDFYTVQELADLAGISDARVRQILLDGRQLRGSKVGQSWIVSKTEAVRWLADRKRDK